MKRTFVAAVCGLLSMTAAAASAQVVENKSLNFEGAKIVAAVAAQVSSNPPSDSSGVTHIPAVNVNDAFAKGVPLLETGGYKIHASRREAPGMAEVHLKDTDIIYVLEGTATLVTGGEVVGGKTTATDEIRGASIHGGRPQRLAKGDLFVVPNGVAHWFTEVQGPFLYYVVKATTATGGAR